MKDWRKAIAEYDEKVKSGEITFDGEFAKYTGDPADPWISGWLANHLPADSI